jgi:hypothetical protein
LGYRQGNIRDSQERDPGAIVTGCKGNMGCDFSINLIVVSRFKQLPGAGPQGKSFLILLSNHALHLVLAIEQIVSLSKLRLRDRTYPEVVCVNQVVFLKVDILHA